MGNVSTIVKQMKKEKDKVETPVIRIEFSTFRFHRRVYGKTAKPTRKRRKMSAKARAKIGAAQKARWKVWKAKQKKAA